MNVTIKEEGDGDLVFSSARRQIIQAITKQWHQRLVGKLFMGLIVGTARVKQVQQLFSSRRFVHCFGSHSLSSKVIHYGPPVPPSRVYVQGFTLDPLLTEALRNPHLLLRPTTYPLNVDAFGSSPADSNTTLGHKSAQFTNELDGNSTITCIEHDGQDIIVVRRVIDRAKVAWLLILLLFLSPALGIGVGICSHNADVGIAVSAGIFALASFVQGLVAWVQG